MDAWESSDQPPPHHDGHHAGPRGDRDRLRQLRESLEAAVARSAHAHRDTVRIASEILDLAGDVGSSAPAPRRRPDQWPQRQPEPEAERRPEPAPLPGLRAYRPLPEPEPSVLTTFLAGRDRVTLGLSVLGAVITVIGLVFLTVQAFSRGWLGPASAVTGAAVLCVLLVAAAFPVHRRTPAGPVAPTLLVVGVLGLFTDLWVLVFGLQWLDPSPGIVLVAVIAAAGLGTARWWDQQTTAVILLLAGSGFITPAMVYLLTSGGDDTRYDAAALPVLALVGLLTTLHRAWPAASLASAAVFSVGVLVLTGDGQSPTVAAVTVLGIAASAWLSLQRPVQSVALAAFSRWIPFSLFPVLCLLGADGAGWSRAATTVACLALGAVTTAFAVLAAARSGGSLRPRRIGPAPEAAGGVTEPDPADTLRSALCCGIAGIVVVLAARQDDPFTPEALGWMIALLAVMTVVALTCDRLPVSLTWILGAVTMVYALPRTVPAWIPAFPAFGDAAVLMWPPLVLLAVPGVLVLRRAASLGATRGVTTAVAGVLLVVVSSAVPLLFLTVNDSDLSFMAGHLVTSVIWMSLGVSAVSRGTGYAGLGLAALASAKLVFYDLSALSGLIQVAAFIICGVILLVAAVRRERTAGRDSEPESVTPAP